MKNRIFIVPMMDWTDRHCRYFMRSISPEVGLYTEKAPVVGAGDSWCTYRPGRGSQNRPCTGRVKMKMASGVWLATGVESTAYIRSE